MEPDAIAKALSDRHKRPILEAALILEAEHTDDATYLGWSYDEVGASPIRLMHLIADGIVRKGYSSHRYTFYLLTDRAAVREAVEESDRLETTETPAAPILPATMFGSIYGHDGIKDVFRRALSAPRPVHVLMTGPPGTAKSLFLEELAELPGARYILGDTSSRAGMLDFLFTEATCRYLIIDELDKADVKDLSILLSLMERGILASMKKGNTQQARRTVWVFAGCNRKDRLPAPLLSRFWQENLEPYTDVEFAAIVESLLTGGEQIDREFARFIAHELLGRTRDVRAAVQVARLSSSPADAARLMQERWPK